jgi:hypothetical protein
LQGFKKQKIQKKILFVTYLTFGVLLVYSHSSASSQKIELILTTLWLGFVLAISFMEAWVKFKAPFCPRHFALDIGRNIFPALNAIEVALCLSHWMLWLRTLNETATALGYYLLMLLTIFMCLEVGYLTPLLEIHRKAILFAALKEENKTIEVKNIEAWKELEKEMKEAKSIGPKKAKTRHFMYVTIEVLKLICLAYLLVLY